MKIFIYGVPGVGKTYFSRALGKKMGIKVIEADGLRKLAQKDKPRNKYPFLYLSTCKAYKEFGELNEANAIKGLLAVRQALQNVVNTELTGTKDFVLEGAFLDPNQLKGLGRMILLTTTDENRHKKQFLTHREKSLDFAGAEFESARIVQKYLMQEAKHLNIEIVDNQDAKLQVVPKFTK